MSVRNTVHGSWYIQTLCNTIYKFHDKLDLMSIMTVMKHHVAYNHSFGNTGEKQIPCTETTLTKLLFLHNEAVSNMHLSKNVQSKSINQKSIDITDSQSLPNPVNSNVLDGKYISHPLFYQHYKIVVLGCAIAVLGGIFITWFKSISGNCQCHWN